MNNVKKLKLSKIILIASLLFGMMFGAGNLIFPIHMGQLAGQDFLIASIGFIITAVGVPVLGVIALGTSGTTDMREMAKPIGKIYSIILTMALYLTIGPFFAIPRCATTAFTVGVEYIVGDSKFSLFLYSLIYFIIVLYFSFRGGKIITWVGKYINPAFLIFYGVLLVIAIVNPIGDFSTVTPSSDYINQSFTKGIIEGYGTMDAIAGIAFGIIIIDNIKKLGADDDASILYNIAHSGIYCCIVMALIYLLSTYMGAASATKFPVSENGGIALREVSNHYFGEIGNVLLSIIVTLATLKTAIGLITSIAEMFYKLFPNFIKKEIWVVFFTLFSFAVANVGLTAIITYAVPVLMLLYPLTITLIILGLFSKKFDNSPIVYRAVTIFAFIPAFIDMLNTLPGELKSKLNVDSIVALASKYLPLFDIGLSWLVPSAIGLVIGLILYGLRKKTT